jgi:hypothetical protein
LLEHKRAALLEAVAAGRVNRPVREAIGFRSELANARLGACPLANKPQQQYGWPRGSDSGIPDQDRQRYSEAFFMLEAVTDNLNQNWAIKI